MSENLPQVHVVDDDAAVRSAMEALLGSVGLRVRTYANADAFLSAADPNMRGCLLLDVRMPGLGGLELQPKLRELGILMPVIFITGHGDVPMAVRALKAGAIDFIEKPFNEQHLLDRIHACIAEDLQNLRDREVRETAKACFQQLTPREIDVMERIAAGYHSKTIAAELDIKERTVDVHRFNIMRKVGVRNMAELLQRWLQSR